MPDVVNIVLLLLAALVAWIIFSLVIFPVTVMFIFALPYIFPYILGAVAIYFAWKFLKGR